MTVTKEQISFRHFTDNGNRFSVVQLLHTFGFYQNGRQTMMQPATLSEWYGMSHRLQIAITSIYVAND
jgi:hypothetical protein